MGPVKKYQQGPRNYSTQDRNYAEFHKIGAKRKLTAWPLFIPRFSLRAIISSLLFFPLSPHSRQHEATHAARSSLVRSTCCVTTFANRSPWLS